MNNEKFKLWKLALSTIHVDGAVSPEEIHWFRKTLDRLTKNSLLNFPPDQIQELEASLTRPTRQFKEEFKKLTNPADCSQLVHIFRIVSHLDKDFSEDEKSLYKELEELCFESVNLEEIQSQIKQMEKESYHEDNVYKVHNPHSKFEAFFKSIMKVLNPGDYEFPD
ncbi:MAG: hypothetical protein ACPGJV_08355 [Bacteriovoracaceae bacterium]